MEYLGAKGGLLAYIIPLNFLIGEYIIYLKLKNKHRVHIHILVLVISILVSFLSYQRNMEAYYPFTICGAVLIGIVQNEIKCRKRTWETDDHELELWVDKLKIILGVILFLVFIIRPIHVALFCALPDVVREYSLFVVGGLVIELIIFNFILKSKRAEKVN